MKVRIKNIFDEDICVNIASYKSCHLRPGESSQEEFADIEVLGLPVIEKLKKRRIIELVQVEEPKPAAEKTPEVEEEEAEAVEEEEESEAAQVAQAEEQEEEEEQEPQPAEEEDSTASTEEE